MTFGFTDIEQARNKIDALTMVHQRRGPAQFVNERLVDFYPVKRNYVDLQESFGTSDHPLEIEAMFREILESDNPMILNELKKLYMLGKLAIPADNPHVNSAYNHVQGVNRKNREVTEKNRKGLENYKEEMRIFAENKKANFEEFCSFWDDCIDKFYGYLSTITDLKKTTFWQSTIINSINEHSHFFYKKLRADWYKRKNFDMEQFKSASWKEAMPDEDSLTDGLFTFANKVINTIELTHEEFIRDELMAVYDKIITSSHFREEEVWVRQLMKRRIWSSNSDLYFSNSTSKWSHSLEQYVEKELDMLYKRANDQAHAVILDRHLNKEDGYDKIYSDLTMSHRNYYKETDVYAIDEYGYDEDELDDDDI